MKPIIKFIGQSIVVGIVTSGLAYIVITYIMNLVNKHITDINLYKIGLGFIAVFTIGMIVNLILVNPINLMAKLVLNGVVIFYQEFLKQGAKYFTSTNLNQPFQTIVEVSIDDNIQVLGFLANKMKNNTCIIFIPTSRRLTSGFNIIVKAEKVKNTEISPEEFLKYIVTSGAHQIHF